MENIVLSVITINYNNVHGLEKTLDSVVNQTWKEFEYIVIDGGSSDDSPLLIKEYSSKISYWISEIDDGIYNAMNKGIKKAKGKYLLFLNSGDYLFDDNVFQNIFRSFDSDIDFICGNLYFEQNGKKLIKEHPEKMTFSHLVSRTVCHPSTFIKKSLFEKYDLYNENNKIVSDWEFFFKTMGLNGATYKKLDQIITNFDTTGISSVQQELVLEEKKKILKNYLPYIFNNENDEYIFNKYKETNKRFMALKNIDKNVFFRKIASSLLFILELFVKMFDKKK